MSYLGTSLMFHLLQSQIYSDFLCPQFMIFTARKPSLGQGNVFTPICQSFCSQGECTCARTDTIPGRHTPFGKYPPKQTPLPLGRHPFPRRQLKRAIHILLECILVANVVRNVQCLLEIFLIETFNRCN